MVYYDSDLLLLLLIAEQKEPMIASQRFIEKVRKHTLHVTSVEQNPTGVIKYRNRLSHVLNHLARGKARACTRLGFCRGERLVVC